MTHPPHAITIDVADLVARALQNGLDDSFAYLGYLCGNDAGQPPDIAAAPAASCWPSERALHGWAFDCFGSFPLPPETNTASVLVRLAAVSGGFRLVQDKTDYRREPYIAWLDSNVAGWRSVEMLAAGIDPADRTTACFQQLATIITHLERFEAIACSDEDEGGDTDVEKDDEDDGTAFDPRHEALLDIGQMILATGITPGVETTWSTAYAAVRRCDYEAMVHEYGKPQTISDHQHLLTGLAKEAYNRFLSTGSLEIERWGKAYLKHLDRLAPTVIPGSDGRRVAQALQYLVMFYERRQQIPEAVAVCRTAIEHQLHDTTKGGFERRLAKLSAR